MRLSLKALVAICSLVFMLVVCGHASPITIKGKVVGIDSDIKIEYEGKWAPELDDPVEIGFELGDDFIPFEGDWRIVLVEHKHVWARNKGAAGDKPTMGSLVNIQSKDPLIRAELIPPEPEEKTNTFAGKWNTNFGVLEISIQGNKFTGHYPHDKGKLEGEMSKDGTTLTGHWSEAPSYEAPQDKGRMIFKLNPDKKAFNGEWAYGDEKSTQEWSGTKIE